MSEQLTLEEVLHVARLARLRLDDEQAKRYRGQLSAVNLDAIKKKIEETIKNHQGQ